ncbi:MAG: DUF3078 domain-containing protein [Candidatus Helarchaeota archaeon]|nr:DUF3078 domain-containing protein [Candidatus Helarchaeota archaeon]
MKRIVCNIVIFLFILPTIIFSEEGNKGKQEEIWLKQIITGLTITQVSYSNWVKGGENALSWTASVDMKFEKDDKKKNWSTVGKFAFGQTKQENLEIRKSVDKIDISSVYTYKYKRALNPFLGGTILTQFATGYDYSITPKVPKSNFFDPVYLQQSVGAGFLLNSSFKTRIGIAIREIISKTYAKWGYTDNPDTPEIEKYKIEKGITSVTTVYKKIEENFLIDSKLEMFSKLDGIKNVDIKFENTFTAQVAKYIVVKFETLIYYDRDISKTIQTKQSLGMGFNFNLF